MEAGEFALSKKFPRSLPGAGGDGQVWNCNDRNEPADYKSCATGTVNHESNLLSCEISLQVVYVQIWQMICLYLRSGFVSQLTLFWYVCVFIDLH